MRAMPHSANRWTARLAELAAETGGNLARHAGRYERTSRRFDISVRDSRLHGIATTTGQLAAAREAEPEEFDLYPADLTGDSLRLPLARGRAVVGGQLRAPRRPDAIPVLGRPGHAAGGVVPCPGWTGRWPMMSWSGARPGAPSRCVSRITSTAPSAPRSVNSYSAWTQSSDGSGSQVRSVKLARRPAASVPPPAPVNSRKSSLT